MECVFCRIAKGELPCAKVFEDDRVLSFLSIRPVQPGHTIVILKKHFPTLLELPRDEVNYLVQIVQKVAKAVKEVVKADGFIVSMNNGRAAGQEVDHAHFHIIPRFQGDGLVPWKEGSYSDGEMERLAGLIRETL